MAKKRSTAKARRKKSRPASGSGTGAKQARRTKPGKRKSPAKSKAAPASSRKPVKRRKSAKAASPVPVARAGGAPSVLQRQASPRTMLAILHPSADAGFDPDFRDAPEGWTRAAAVARASAAGLALTEDHWEVVRVLQGSYRDEASPRLRLLRDALEARFASKGGMKYLYRILPGGPIAQGCALAGLKPPHGAQNASFGSVA